MTDTVGFGTCTFFCFHTVPNNHLLPAATKLGKGKFSQACVKNSVHRGGRVSASVHAGIHSSPGPPGPGTPPRADPPWSRHPPSRHPPGPAPLGSRLQHTVNERPVRILLECILVLLLFHNMFVCGKYDKCDTTTFFSIKWDYFNYF